MKLIHHPSDGEAKALVVVVCTFTMLRLLECSTLPLYLLVLFVGEVDVPIGHDGSSLWT